MDPEAYDSGDEYWFYGLSNGGVVSSQIRSIDNHSYGFNEVGEMLHGLYKMTVDGKTILTYTKIESADELPDKDAPEDVYYFGDSPKEGVMETGKTTVELDGEKYTYYFATGGDTRGAGVEGVRDGYIYEKGRRLEIEDGLRYGIVEYDGEAYLVNQSGKIQKNKKNAKDSDGVYYSSDKDGIVIHQGDKQE